ncbi:TPA: Dot/Icm T4SS effector SidB [Legionella pneumophila subsp. pneumophila]|uniref:Dot/Icm T4SS effector SidB n=1 Tax=Legionella pneumophila TaxID=446 RepID=UPI0001E3C87A|nr:Dot/Icm T4SS effector SidB [Legionella pneumophila]MDC8030202.1 Dot/Icm T4SS effector SidB [Legionella pneumophila subsp. pneumophila]MDW8869840.1 Dot/Icm T4SS effector SidB [Legionella pneumophila]MDW8915969.1 Dot/Icm T4SS effector SidB [Legionella pneumophila]MDW8925379.1 Dot/Icm T4SS effector SidB [Legionella pneumophila]MDW8931453.1 Dot/Icm T4SS effector SidB [Legionella pneumophila]
MVKIYNAPKPKYSGWEWFKFIAIRTVFPPVLLWDLIKIGANKLLGEWVSGLVLPAQNENFDDLAVSDDTVSNYNEDELICEKHDVITHDGAHLDTFEVRHRSQESIDPKYQKYIINLVGNGMCYEHIIDDIKEDSKALKANVIGFNLRGVGQSTGKAKSSEDLVADGIAQVQRLLDQGVSPQNITLKGHSLGAGVASLVAQYFHQLGQPINLFNSRSFSTITNFLVGHMRLERDEIGRAIGHKDSTVGTILGWLAKPFIKLGVALAKWEINAGSAFKSVPEAYKDYIVVRSRKEIRGERIDDAVIPHYASIHKELSSERHKKKAEIDEEIANLDDIIRKADPLAKPGLANARDALVQAREKIKSDRKMETDVQYANGHNSDWNALHNRSGKSAQTFFREFVQRTEADHAVKSIPEIN